MRCVVFRKILTLAGALALSACTARSDPSSDEQHVKIDTESELAWQQYQANLRFAEDYEPVCHAKVERSDEPGVAPRPRVIVTGFGRFHSNQRNATGEIVSELLEGLTYPLTEPPRDGELDPPAPQTAVAFETIELPSMVRVVK